MAKEGAAGRWFLRGIGLLLVLAGGVFCALMGRSFLRAREMATWPEVPCVILRAEVGERQLGPAVPSEYRFEVLYGYQWLGQNFESDRLTLRGSPWCGSPDPVEEWRLCYPVGSRAVCRVNPADPALAVLKIDSRAPGYSLWFPALIVVAGGGIIAGSLRRPQRTRGPAAAV